MEPSLFQNALSSPAWAVHENLQPLSAEEELRLHYQRAREMCRCSDIGARDSAMHTILTIHWNLCMGTIASIGRGRADLRPLLHDLEKFDVCGEFMLTEIGHGLDARNIETTATLLSDGSFDLNTPSFSAAKIMPPTTLLTGMPRVAVVFAQLVIDDEVRGVRPFVVPLNHVDRMCQGITSKPLPKRAGAKVVDHAVTFFNHVNLPCSALLCSPEKMADERAHFLSLIWRVSIGTLALSIVNPAQLSLCAYIVGKYSQRRRVTSTSQPDQTVPIISFRTQQLPILAALAKSSVFSQFSDYAIAQFTNRGLDMRVRHGIACTFKALVVQSAQSSMNELVDRLGWQGLFGYNIVVEQMMANRGIAIAEGDILVLCIRLASEIILGRYEMPKAKNPEALLARHEAGVIEAARAKLQESSGEHRSDEFNALVLPRCRGIVEAIGHRMAYESAVNNGKVRSAFLSLFEVQCIKADLGWYVQHAGVQAEHIFQQEVSAASELECILDQLLDETHAEPHATAAIMSDDTFRQFIEELPSFTDGSKQDANPMLEIAKL